MENFDNITIQELREAEGFRTKIIVSENSPLSVWYGNIQDKKLIDLHDADIAKLIRQNLNILYVIPQAIKRLQGNPVSGKRYEGELLFSLLEVDAEFWKANLEISSLVMKFLEQLHNNEVKFPNDFEWGDSEQEQEFYLKVEEILLFLRSI